MAYNILIVDDSATTRAMIRRTVTLAQVPVQSLHEAPDGQAALALLEAQPIDLVLADLNMPVMGGVEMTRRMRASDKLRHVPVVVVSAEPNAMRLTELVDAGIQGYVRKPFTPENIRKAINNVLEAANV